MFVEEYRPYVVGLLVIILAQTVVIGFLLRQWALLKSLRATHEAAVMALKESQVRNTAILNTFPDLMFLMDADGTYLDWHAGDSTDLYVPPEHFLGKKMQDIMPPDLAERFTQGFRRALSSGGPVAVEYELNIRGKVQFFETRIVKCGDGRLLSIVRNVTDKKNVEMELHKLSSRILSLQDEERRRIARELHDVTAQNLFAITVNLQNLCHRETGLTAGGQEVFDECLAQCEQSLREVRTLSYVLHPPGLDRLGLIPALQWYVDGFAKRSGIAIMLTADQEMGRLLPEMEMDVFRIVQEGLSNVFRHSGSLSATILIEKRDGRLFVEIKDRGRGMPDWNSDSPRSVQLGVGLLSIRERLNRFGGRLDIRSARSGVSLVASVPVPTEVAPS
jgi:PAS domain S-box-containing protein